MRRLLGLRWVHAGAWTLATAAAVTLSWFGVHTVLAGTDYDPPRALPVSEATTAQAEPQSSSTHRPKPSPSSAPPSRTKSPEKDADGEPKPSRSPRRTPRPSRTSGPPAGSGDVKGTTVDGGRAVFDMGDASASLVSATPEAGWEMRVWNDATWIRVTFSRGDVSSSVFCRWDDGEPRIETFDG